MEKEDLPISVIITNHERKKYVRDAITSVKTSADKAGINVEIILVMDYHDEDIEKFASERNVIVIFRPEIELGIKLKAGIERARGKYLCFLDDDDMFHPEKIGEIYRVMNDSGISFYHNAIKEIGEDDTYFSIDFQKVEDGWEKKYDIMKMEKGMVGEILRERSDWYLSSMAISSEIAKKYSPIVGKCVKSLDKVIFLIGIAEGKSIVISTKKITFYRKHVSITGIKADTKSFSKSRLQFTRMSIKTMEIMESIKIENNPIYYHIINLMRTKMKANAIIYGDFSMERKDVEYQLNHYYREFECEECRKLRILLKVHRYLPGTVQFIYRKVQTRGI